MFLIGLGKTVGEARGSRREGWALPPQPAPVAALASRASAILRKVLTGDNGLQPRHRAVNPLAKSFD